MQYQMLLLLFFTTLVSEWDRPVIVLSCAVLIGFGEMATLTQELLYCFLTQFIPKYMSSNLSFSNPWWNSPTALCASGCVFLLTDLVSFVILANGLKLLCVFFFLLYFHFLYCISTFKCISWYLPSIQMKIFGKTMVFSGPHVYMR